MSSGTPAEPRDVSGPAGAGTGRPGHDQAREQQDLLYLRQFFYQCPVGLFETDDAGAVRMVNPAAVNMLAPVIGSGDLSQLFPLLGQLVPGMIDVISRDPSRMGPLAAGQGMLIRAGAHGEAYLEMQAVRVAAGRVMVVLQDVSAERQLALREHEIAVELQLALLGHAGDVPGLPFGVTYRTAEDELQVGGDWYDVIRLPGDCAALVVGDVVGHNLAATTAMGQLRSAIRATARYCPEPVELLQQADTLAEETDGAECATVAYALLDFGSHELRYASAGHPPILIAHADATAGYLCGGRGLPLAVADLPRTGDVYQLAPGDIVIMYTDGLYERRDEAPDERLARLARLAASCSRLPLTELSRALTDGMLGGAEPQDDICVLVAAPQ